MGRMVSGNRGTALTSSAVARALAAKGIDQADVTISVGATSYELEEGLQAIGLMRARVTVPVTVGLKTNYVPTGKEFMAYLAPFGADQNGWPTGVGYSASLSIADQNRYPNGGLTLDWSMPDGADFPTVGGYYQLFAWGQYSTTPANVFVQPCRLRDIDTLKSEFKWDYSGSENFNQLNEFFSSPNDVEPWPHVNEIAFWGHAGDWNWLQGLKNLGTMTDSDGFTWRCRVGGVYYIFYPDTATTRETLLKKDMKMPWADAIKWLLVHPTDPIDGSAYFHGFACGIEPTDGGGTGQFTIDPSVPIAVEYSHSVKPTIALTGPSSVNEGNSGNTEAVYTFTRSNSSGAISFPWHYVPGTASASDFAGGVLPAGGTVELADGQASASVTIIINGDTELENSETFGVRFAPPAPYVAAGKPIVMTTILNDDVVTPPTGGLYTSTALTDWGGGGTNRTTNSQVAPDGTTTAMLVSETTSTSTHKTWKSGDLTGVTHPAGRRTFSLYAKRIAGSRKLALEVTQGANVAGWVFDIAAGTSHYGYGAGSNFTNRAGSIAPVGGDWFLLELSYDMVAGNSTALSIGTKNMTSAFADSYTGDTAQQHAQWGAKYA